MELVVGEGPFREPPTVMQATILLEALNIIFGFDPITDTQE